MTTPAQSPAPKPGPLQRLLTPKAPTAPRQEHTQEIPQWALDVTVSGGKYTVRQSTSGNLWALRHGEPWQELTGNNLVLALAQEVDRLRHASSPAARVEQKKAPGNSHDSSESGFLKEDDVWLASELPALAAVVDVEIVRSICSQLAQEIRLRRTMESAHGEMLSECVKLRAQLTSHPSSGEPASVGVGRLIAKVEAAHFRTDEDTGANPNALLIWNLVREYAGLPRLTVEQLPSFCYACRTYHKADTACALATPPTAPACNSTKGE